MIAIASGTEHSLALKSDGTVWAWGNNMWGQLGDGTNTDRNAPVQVSNLSGVAALAGGASHSLALKNDGTMWAWGSNWNGGLGNGTTTDSSVPVQVIGNCNVVSGVNEESAAQPLNIFPNPSSGIFTVECESSDVLLEVRNLLGEIIVRQNKAGRLDLSAARKGIYAVTLREGAHVRTSKIVVQ